MHVVRVARCFSLLFFILSFFAPVSRDIQWVSVLTKNSLGFLLRYFLIWLSCSFLWRAILLLVGQFLTSQPERTKIEKLPRATAEVADSAAERKLEHGSRDSQRHQAPLPVHTRISHLRSRHCPARPRTRATQFWQVRFLKKSFDSKKKGKFAGNYF